MACVSKVIFQCIFVCSVAETILNISECSSHSVSKLVTEVSVSNVNDKGNPTTENGGKVKSTEEAPKNSTNVPTADSTQSPSPTTQQPNTAETIHDPIKIHLKERCIRSMGERMRNKNYTVQYMNYAGINKNRTYFTTIYKYDTEAKDHTVQCSLSYERTREIFNKAALENKIVYLLVPYVVDSVEQYCIGLRKRKNGEPKALHTIGLTPASADQLYNTYKKFNYQLTGERYVVINDEVKATLVYKYSSSTQQVKRYRHLSYSALMNKIVEGQRSGYHIEDMSSYTLKGINHYSLLLTPNFHQIQYRWSLRSKQRTSRTLKRYTKEGLYPLAIISANLGYSEPYYLVSLTSTA